MVCERVRSNFGAENVIFHEVITEIKHTYGIEAQFTPTKKCRKTKHGHNRGSNSPIRYNFTFSS